MEYIHTMMANSSIDLCIKTGVETKALPNDFDLNEELRGYLIGLVTSLNSQERNGKKVVEVPREKRAMITGFIAAVNRMNQMELRQ